MCKFFKNIWKKLWDSEDSRLFGEIGLIIGSILIAKWFDKTIPETKLNWIYVAIGFLFVLFSVKLLRKSESNK